LTKEYSFISYWTSIQKSLPTGDGFFVSYNKVHLWDQQRAEQFLLSTNYPKGNYLNVNDIPADRLPYGKGGEQ